MTKLNIIKKRKLRIERLLTIAGMACVGSAFIVGVFLQNPEIEEKQKESCVLDKHSRPEKEPKLELQGWMLHLDAWDNKQLERLEPIELKSGLAEENFTLVNRKFVNLLALEEEPDIPLEDWMLSPKKMMKDL